MKSANNHINVFLHTFFNMLYYYSTLVDKNTVR